MDSNTTKPTTEEQEDGFEFDDSFIDHHDYLPPPPKKEAFRDALVYVTTMVQNIHKNLSFEHMSTFGGEFDASYEALEDIWFYLSKVLDLSEIPRDMKVKRECSVSFEWITCMRCGDDVKNIEEHLFNEHGTIMEDYLETYKLPKHYPRIAPNVYVKSLTVTPRAYLHKIDEFMQGKDDKGDADPTREIYYAKDEGEDLVLNNLDTSKHAQVELIWPMVVDICSTKKNTRVFTKDLTKRLDTHRESLGR